MKPTGLTPHLQSFSPHKAGGEGSRGAQGFGLNTQMESKRVCKFEHDVYFQAVRLGTRYYSDRNTSNNRSISSGVL